MLTMKGDMGGAAAVTGAILAAALRKAKVDVVGVMALVENMPSGTSLQAWRHREILAGKTLKIFDTDAEGRVTLVESLHYAARKLKPVLHPRRRDADLFGNRGGRAGLRGLVRERRWAGYGSAGGGRGCGRAALALAGECGLREKPLVPSIADYKPGERPTILGADAPHAAALMGEFVNNLPWAHLDIANKEFADQAPPSARKAPAAMPLPCSTLSCASGNRRRAMPRTCLPSARPGSPG